MSGMEMLTPTPVAPPLSSFNQKAGVNMGVNVASASGSSQSNSDGSSTSLLSDEDGKKIAADSGGGDNKRSTVIKSLGNFSLKEFEGDTTDPFEMAALQAINDMEELQSVLQPSLVGANSTSTGFSSAPPHSASTLTSTTSHLSSHLGPPPPISSNFPVSQPSPPLLVAVVSPLSSNLAMPSFSPAAGTTCSSSNMQLASEPSSTVSSSSKNSKSSPELGGPGTGVNQYRRHSDNTVSSSGPPGPSQQQTFRNSHPSTVLSGDSFGVTAPVSRASSNPVTSSQFQSSPENAHSVSYPVIPPSPELQHLLQEEGSDKDRPLQHAWSNPSVSGLVDIAPDSSKKAPVPAPRISPKLTVSVVVVVVFSCCCFCCCFFVVVFDDLFCRLLKKQS